MATIYTRIRDNTVVPESEAMAGGLLQDGYRASGGTWGPGEYLSFNLALCDSAAKPMMLRDASGTPVTLHDERTGATMKLNSDLITAIENEAAKLGLSVNAYVQHVLKYSWASAKLSGSVNAGSPAAKETR